VKTNPLKWREKLHPAFFELAQIWRDITKRVEAVEEACRNVLRELGPTPAHDSIAEAIYHRGQAINMLGQEFDAKLVEINACYPSLPSSPFAYPWLKVARAAPLGAEREAIGFMEWLHSERHGEPLENTLNDVNAGSLSALHKLQRTQEDLFRMEHEQGPLKEFQGNLCHRDLLELGFCFGMERLTSEELADCFEEYCPCGKDHDADALKKQRARLIREFRSRSTESGKSSIGGNNV
jgi:hypothetical protein